jgi:hypothetical protein
MASCFSVFCLYIHTRALFSQIKKKKLHIKKHAEICRDNFTLDLVSSGRRRFRARIHKLSENLGATSKLYASEKWREVSYKLVTQKY